MSTPGGRAPLGVVLVSAVLVLYAGFWLLTGGVAGAVGNRFVVALSVAVAAGVVGLAYGLSRGSRAAWWVALAFIGASTLWRLSLVAGGALGNLSNAIVGLVLFGYLAARADFFRPPGR